MAATTNPPRPIDLEYETAEDHERAAAQAEALRVAEEVAALNGITVTRALAAMQGVVEMERRLGLGPTTLEREAERQASMSRADRRREQHNQKVERRTAARQRSTR